MSESRSDAPHARSARIDRPSRRTRIAEWFARRCLPQRRARRATSFVAMLGVLAFGGFFGSRLHSGEGMLVDVGIGAGLALALVVLLPLALVLVAAVARLLPRSFGYFGAGAFLTFAYALGESGFSDERAALAGLLCLLLVGLLFGNIATLTGAGFGERSGSGKLRTVVGLIVGIAGAGTVGWYVTHAGRDDYLIARPVAAEGTAGPPSLELPNPGQPGSFAVHTLTYGSGVDRREEFGQEAVLKTEPVNGKPFVEWPSGWKGDMRKRYWGFDAGRLPLNGRVWHPDDEGPFPLVLCVHGNHHMADYSDPGYSYLGELLASRGIVFVSVDQNFLNGGGILHGGMGNENDARGWLLLEHLRVWREWNATDGHRFEGKVDLERVGLIGHSRGGEAVCHAAVFNRLSRYPDDASVEFDYGFGLQAICSIAPIDGQYRAAGVDTAMRDVSYFVIHGGHDADVSSFYGDRLYRRLSFTDTGRDRFKASLWVYRANHGQFNTVWIDDSPPPGSLFLNRRPLLSGEEQRQIAKVHISAFLEATLHGEGGYRRLFRDHRVGRAWLPDVWMVSRYEDASFRALADFQEDVDVTTTTLAGGVIETAGLEVWREGEIPFRDGARRQDNGVFVGWNVESAEEGDDDAAGDEGVAEAAGGGEPVAVDPAAAVAEPAPSVTITLVAPIGESLGATVAHSFVFHCAEVDEKPKAKDYAVREDEDSEEGSDENEGQADADGANGSTDRAPIDFTLELTDADGARAAVALSRFGEVPPPMKVRLRRDPTGRSKDTFEPTLQRFEIPLAAFADATPGLRPEAVRMIRIVFDRSPKGVVVLDRIGIAN